MKAVFYLLGSVVLILIILALTGVISIKGLLPESKVEVITQQSPSPWYNSFYDPWRRRGPRWGRDRDIVELFNRINRLERAVSRMEGQKH